MPLVDWAVPPPTACAKEVTPAAIWCNACAKSGGNTFGLEEDAPPVTSSPTPKYVGFRSRDILLIPVANSSTVPLDVRGATRAGGGLGMAGGGVTRTEEDSGA